MALTVGGKGRVTLTEDVRKHLKVEEGDVVLVRLGEGGTAELIPAALIPRDQVWFTHPEMQERVAEAHADIAAGRTTSVRTKAEMRAAIAKLKRSGRAD